MGSERAQGPINPLSALDESPKLREEPRTLGRRVRLSLSLQVAHAVVHCARYAPRRERSARKRKSVLLRCRECIIGTQSKLGSAPARELAHA